MSSGVVEMGTTERQWLKQTLIADRMYQEDSVTAYKSGQRFFHFRGGVLVKVDTRLHAASDVLSLPASSGAKAAQDSAK